jgi:cell division inhibitor SulA/protein ImuA
MNPLLQSVLENPAIWRGSDLPPPVGAVLPSGFAALDAELPGGGWPQGSLVEILADGQGIGELSLLLPALKALTREGRGIVWILPGECPQSLRDSPPRDGVCPQSLRDSPPRGRATVLGRPGDSCSALPCVPYAPALSAAGIALGHCLVVTPETAPDGLWAAEQALRSGACGAVLAWLDGPAARPDYRALRRLQLAAEAGGALAFLHRPAAVATTPSPAPLRLALGLQEAHLCVRLLKRRGAALSSPLLLAVQGLRWRPALMSDFGTASPAGGLVPAASVASLPASLTAH